MPASTKKVKKMMMIMAVVLAAGLSQAANVSWYTGAIKAVADASGTFGAEIGATSGIYFATVFFYSDALGENLIVTTDTTDNSTDTLSCLSNITLAAS